MTIQIRRRIGAAGAPTTLAEGQLAYGDPAAAANDDALYIGSDQAGSPVVRTLVSSQRQVEIAATQTITGPKTISTANLHITGGSANDILTTDGSGNISWTAAPSGGLLTVATDSTLSGNGQSGTPLSVQHLATARTITLQAAPPAGNGTQTTFDSVTAASFDGSSNVTISNIAISLNDGTY